MKKKLLIGTVGLILFGFVGGIMYGLLSGNFQVALATSNCNAGADLTGHITGNGNATITNNSSSCSYQVGLASYKVFDTNINSPSYFTTQELFGNDVRTIAPHATLNLHVNVPGCAYQIDLFQGDLLTHLNQATGEWYGSRKIDFANITGNTCSNNQPQTGTLTVIKYVSNTHGGTRQPSDFALYVDGMRVQSGETKTLNAGAYIVSEQNLPGYQAGTWGGDCNASGAVKVNAGDHKTCTITNSDIGSTPSNLEGSCDVDRSPVFVGDSVTWTAHPTGGSGHYIYSWSGWDGITGTTQTVQKSYTTAGAKTSVVVISDGVHSITRNCSVKVNDRTPIGNNLNGSCDTNPANANINDTVTWTAHPTGGTGNYTYSWSGTDGLNGSSQSVQRQYSSSGTKLGTVVISDGHTSITRNCSTNVNQQQNNNLTVSCSASASSVAMYSSVIYTANASGGNGNYSYSWSGSDGLSGSGQTTSTSYSSTGSKYATVVVTSNGQTVSATCNTSIFQQGYPSGFTASCYAYPSQANVYDTVTWNVQAYGGSGNYTYSWSGTDGLTGYGSSVSRQYTYSGQKSANVIVTSSNGQVAYANCSMNVGQQYVPPTNNMSVYCSANPTTAYVGDTITWYANPSGGSYYNNNYYNNNYNYYGNNYYGNNYYNYSWTGSDGLYGSNQTVSYTYNTPGQKVATVTVNSNGQTVSQTCTVNVLTRGYVTLPPVPPSNQTGGVYLSQVPYTGAGDSTKVTLFILGLIAWSGGLAYYLVYRKAKRQGKTVGEVISNFGSELALSAAGVTGKLPFMYQAPSKFPDVVTTLETRAHELETIVSAQGLELIAEKTNGNADEAVRMLENLSGKYKNQTHPDLWTVLSTEKVQENI